MSISQKKKKGIPALCAVVKGMLEAFSIVIKGMSSPSFLPSVGTRASINAPSLMNSNNDCTNGYTSFSTVGSNVDKSTSACCRRNNNT